MSYCNGKSLCKPYGCSRRGYCLLGRYEFPEVNSKKPGKKIEIKTIIPQPNWEREYWSLIHPKRVVSLIMKGHDAACACCYAIEDLTFDHIIPIVKGGSNALRNGQILCRECNEFKGDEIISIEDLRAKMNIKV